MAKELRTALPTYEERRAAGRALRDQVKRGALGRWRPPEDRADPVGLVEETHSGRLERLIPVRVGRMVASPYAFLRGAAAYRRQLSRLAGQPLLGRSFDRMDIGRMRQEMADWSLRAEIERAANRARLRTSDRALPKLTRESDGVRYIVDQPPLVTHVSDEEKERLIDGLEAYLKTLPPHWHRVLSWYVVVDVAHKVVGVGSVGLRTFVVLLQGNDAHDMLFLQLKQARRSCVAAFVHGATAWHAHQGQRAVEYQQTLQTVSDPLLGWTTVDNRDYYVRQFRDMKGAVTVEGMDGSALMDYGRICGALLAKGHARSTGATMLSGYLGKGDVADRAFTRFARAYADQTEADHRALQQAVKSGRLPAEHGI